MAMQRVLARLSPVLVMLNRDHIPTFEATLKCPANTETSWKDLLAKAPLAKLDSHLFKDKRVVIFGEQHHQPQVLRAQMATLAALHSSAVEESRRVVMVMEHFNFQQDELLSKFSKHEITNDELLEEYSKSNEGFRLNHYLPLLMLARELGVKIHGGFPPRQWASLVYKESLASLQSAKGADIPSTFDDVRWRQVSEISPQQVAYLQSMMSDGSPRLPDRDQVPSEGYLKGILPAQTLKDTFFAWSIDKHLRDRETIVFGVCGLGHSEYHLCVSPRLRNCDRKDILLVASKEWASTEFVPCSTDYRGEHVLADAIIPYFTDSQGSE